MSSDTNKYKYKKQADINRRKKKLKMEEEKRIIQIVVLIEKNMNFKDVTSKILGD